VTTGPIYEGGKLGEHYAWVMKTEKPCAAVDFVPFGKAYYIETYAFDALYLLTRDFLPAVYSILEFLKQAGYESGLITGVTNQKMAQRALNLLNFHLDHENENGRCGIYKPVSELITELPNIEQRLNQLGHEMAEKRGMSVEETEALTRSHAVLALLRSG
jgi:hypothetical protein